MKKAENINFLKENESKSLFNTNPIKNEMKHNLFLSADQFKNKAEYTSKLADFLSLMSEKYLCMLFSSEDELIRGIAVRAYVDKNPSDLLSALREKLKDKNELIRHSAVSALVYLNSPENLELLKEASTDESDAVKLAALTGIVDIAQEYECLEAKAILETFLKYPDEQIRKFIEDELSLLF